MFLLLLVWNRLEEEESDLFLLVDVVVAEIDEETDHGFEIRGLAWLENEVTINVFIVIFSFKLWPFAFALLFI